MTQHLNKNVLYLDCQTTGRSADNSWLLDLAWSVDDQAEVSRIIRQAEPPPPYILKLTGLTLRDLESAVDEKVALEELLATPADVCVIHYAQFELGFLKAALERNGLSTELPWPVICSVAVARRIYSQIPSRSLRGICGFLGHPHVDLNRAHSHVDATRRIWQSCAAKLVEAGLADFIAVKEWLESTKAISRTKTEFLVPREKRLSAPRAPGVYRMLDASGNILYVGKATDLHSRVNSYFRGRRGPGTRKMEMLSRTVDIAWEEAPTPIDAALLEAGLIKQLLPPYNVALANTDGAIAFCDRSLQRWSTEQTDETPIGPFRSLEPWRRLAAACVGTDAPEILTEVFYEEAPHAMFVKVWDEILTSNKLTTFRSLVAFGFKNLSLLKREDDEDEDLLADEDLEATPKVQVEFVWTEEIMRLALTRICARAAWSLAHARWMQRFANAQVYWRDRESGSPWYGWRVAQANVARLAPAPKLPKAPKDFAPTPDPAWSIESYDQLRVLWTELKIALTKGQKVVFRDPRGELKTPQLRGAWFN
jgi:DNA polymerase-3 subunit epsilon